MTGNISVTSCCSDSFFKIYVIKKSNENYLQLLFPIYGAKEYLIFGFHYFSIHSSLLAELSSGIFIDLFLSLGAYTRSGSSFTYLQRRRHTYSKSRVHNSQYTRN